MSSAASLLRDRDRDVERAVAVEVAGRDRARLRAANFCGSLRDLARRVDDPRGAARGDGDLEFVVAGEVADDRACPDAVLAGVEFLHL